MGGLQYYYRVAAANSAGNSAGYSNEANATTTGTYVRGIAWWNGMLWSNVAGKTGVLYNNLQNTNYTRLLLSGRATNPSQPTWWAGPATGTTFGNVTTFDWAGIQWNAANRQGLFGAGDGNSGGGTITIKPNVSTTSVVRMAVIVSTAVNGPASYTITSISVGTNTTTLNQPVNCNSGDLASVGEFLIQVSPNQPIVVALSYTGVSWSGMFLAFEDTATPGLLGTAPLITLDPLPVTAPGGTTATFTSTATGSPGPFYSWLRNNVPLSNGGNVSGATTTNLTVSNVHASDDAGYAMVATTPQGSVTSLVAHLTFALPAVPTLNYSISSGSCTLTWNNPVFSLMSSANVNGPWSVVPGATSPFTTNMTVVPQNYFRLRWQ